MSVSLLDNDDAALIPRLTDERICPAPLGATQPIRTGEVLFREGD